MNRTKLLTIAVIGLLLLNFGILGMMFMHHPDGRPGGPPPPFGRPNEGPKMIIIERLHFDDAQQKQYEVIIKEHHSKTVELNDVSRSKRDELYSLLKNDLLDTAKNYSANNKQ
jgi:protein CpxP